MNKPIIMTNPVKIFLTNVKYTVRRGFWNLLNKMGIPGFVQPFTVSDPLTKTWLTIDVGSVYTVITVNGMDFYFYRRNGKYDGWGRGCADFSQEDMENCLESENLPVVCKE